MGITVTTSSDYENWLQNIDIVLPWRHTYTAIKKKKNNIFKNIKYVLQFTTGLLLVVRG